MKDQKRIRQYKDIILDYFRIDTFVFHSQVTTTKNSFHFEIMLPCHMFYNTVCKTLCNFADELLAIMTPTMLNISKPREMKFPDAVCENCPTSKTVSTYQSFQTCKKHVLT